MAGHSKWANIKHKKAAQDAKRGQVFTKLAKEITISAKLGGGDETANPRLRTAVIKARGANMPKDNIERAIKKGTGELEGVEYEELIYEGYAPGGIAIIMDVMTDKKSRTLPEIKNIFSKAGGSMAEAGSVAYLFEQKGLILVKGDDITEEALLELALEAGAEDLEEDDEKVFAIKTAKEDFNAVLTQLEPAFEEKKWEIIESGLKFIPQAEVAIDEEKAQSVLNLIETLEDHDDVQAVYSNLELSEAMLNVS